MPQKAPQRGEIWFLDLDPVAGHEQAKARPVLVVSPEIFNTSTGLCWVMPITSRIRGQGMETVLPAETDTHGAILIHQLRVVDLHARNGRYVENVNAAVIQEVLTKARLVLS